RCPDSIPTRRSFDLSHHLSLVFQANKKQDESYVGRRIELQVRTRLQHSWATAIEAVSLYRNQDLKHHHGDADWLRLFVLTAAELDRKSTRLNSSHVK